MIRKKWNWDINLPESKIKKILTMENDYRFPRIAGALLSRVDDPKEVFKLITPVAFCRRWRAIELEIKSDEWTKEKAAFWKIIYINLSKELREKGEKIRKPDKIALDNFNRDLISKIKASRKKALLTQGELAELMGCSQQYISGIEKGREKISLDFLRKFAAITNEPLESFPLKLVMEMPIEKQASSEFENPRRKRIYENLLLIGPGPAAFYKDACRLMSQINLDTQTHQVSHSLREVESALRAVLIKMSDFTAPFKTQEEDRHQKEIIAILQMLNIPIDDSTAKIWLSMAGKDNEYSLNARAHRDALKEPRPVDDAFSNFWNDIEIMLVRILTKFREKFLVHLDLLDRLALKTNPNKDDLKLLQNHIPNNMISLGYFLNKCQSEVWLELLSKGQYFAHPSSSESDPTSQTIRYPFWPQSAYLIRMAKIYPKKVSEIIDTIPETDNIYIHTDLVSAALEIPTDYSIKWAEKEIAWISKQSHLGSLLARNLGLFITHLANGGQVAIALDIAKALLKILPDPTKQSKDTDDVSLSLPEPRALFDGWYYGEIIKENIPDLVKNTGLLALNLLCDFLNDAILFSRRGNEDSGSEDYSYIWRESIEYGDESHSRGLENILVSAVRDAGKLLVELNTCKLDEVISILERKNWNIFRRIVFYLLTVFPNKALKSISDRLTNEALFKDHSIRHEYARLLNKCFDLLQPEQRQAIFGWIEKGPDLEEFKQGDERLKGKRPTDEEANRYLKYWQRDHLAWISDKLSHEWKEKYESLIAELGEPEHPESPNYTRERSWVGPTSPKNADELSRMSVPEIVNFLKVWKPEEGWMVPSAEGLGRILTDVAKSGPERFSKEAVSFKEVHPTYIRSLISGLAGALEEKKEIVWGPVLELCQWVIKQPRDTVSQFLGFSKDCDSDWSWTWKSIARFLSVGFTKNLVPFKQRSIVWSIINPITDDPDPSLEREDTSMDPATLAINSVRGEAIDTVICYALWIHRHLENLPDTAEKISRGFEEIKEAKIVLEKHLDTKQDPSLAIRAIYGKWLPWLILVDPRWVRENILKIFPTQKSLRSYYDVTWETYIIFCNIYDNVYSVLKKQYENAIESLGENHANKNRLGDPDVHLTEHLMTLYWRGFFQIDDSENIFSKFWNQATSKLKSHAIKFIGRSLYKTQTDIPPLVLQRLKILWENRLKAVTQSLDPNFYSELIPFGWWFVCAKFDDEWAIVQLSTAVEKTGKIEPDHMVVERLAKIVTQMPEEVMRCFELIVTHDSSDWGIYGWRDPAKDILRQALKTEAASRAQSIINYLVSKGHLEFRELLRTNIK